MSDYIGRMKQEYKSLSLKVTSLNKFIHGNEAFKGLSDLEQAKMIKQSGFMESYLAVLDSRIWAAISNNRTTNDYFKSRK